MIHFPRKRFGQNFLQDFNIINQIIRTLNIKPEDNLIEIGPGRGALTSLLMTRVNQLIAIEIDNDLYANLLNSPEAINGKLQLINQDALLVDYTRFGKNLRIVGNLPYNISTPLLIMLLQNTSIIKDMHFMLQKEVVKRMIAPPCNRDYGRLSVITQYYCEVEELLEVPADAFYPKPKVESSFVRLIPYIKSPYEKVNFNFFETLIAKSFHMRRKTIFNNLKSIISKENLLKLGVEPSNRPEQISVDKYVQIAVYLSNI